MTYRSENTLMAEIHFVHPLGPRVTWCSIVRVLSIALLGESC